MEFLSSHISSKIVASLADGIENWIHSASDVFFPFGGFVKLSVENKLKLEPDLKNFCIGRTFNQDLLKYWGLFSLLLNGNFIQAAILVSFSTLSMILYLTDWPGPL